jgi:membrane protease YdiL (CAAX protease family)
MARHPFSHRLLIYLALIAMKLLRVWYVIAGARANGNGLMTIVGRGWSTWRNAVRDSVLAIGTIVLVTATARSTIFLLGSWSPRTAFMLPTNFAESIGWIVFSIIGAICEEISYRGYLQRQLSAFTGSLPFAVCLQAVAFGAVNFYLGWKPVVVVVVIGFVLGSVAAWRRSIIPGMIAHCILDLVAGFRGG